MRLLLKIEEIFMFILGIYLFGLLKYEWRWPSRYIFFEVIFPYLYAN